MAKKKKSSKGKSSKRSSGKKKPRSAAQKAATARMLAANKRSKKKHGGKKHRAHNPGDAGVTFAANPPKKKHKKRKKNPSIPDVLKRAGSAVAQGFLGAGVIAGAVKLQETFPPKSKGMAVAQQVGAAVLGGALLGAVGLPIAGVGVAAGLGNVALQTATTGPSNALTTGGKAPVSGIIERGPMRGLVEHDRREAAEVAGLVEGLVN